MPLEAYRFLVQSALRFQCGAYDFGVLQLGWRACFTSSLQQAAFGHILLARRRMLEQMLATNDVDSIRAMRHTRYCSRM